MASGEPFTKLYIPLWHFPSADVTLQTVLILWRSEEKWKRCLIATLSLLASSLSCFRLFSSSAIFLASSSFSFLSD